MTSLATRRAEYVERLEAGLARVEPLAEGRRWLEQATHDLCWADDLAQRGGYHIACFLAQQVAEKALKVYLYACGDESVMGHSVQRLGGEIASRDEDPARSARRWAVLDGYYIPTRYPTAFPIASRRSSSLPRPPPPRLRWRARRQPTDAR